MPRTLLSLNVARARAAGDRRPLGDDGDRQARRRRRRARSGRSAWRATSRPTCRSTAARARRSMPTRASTTRSGRRCGRRRASPRGATRSRRARSARTSRWPGVARDRGLDRRRAALPALRARGQRAALPVLQVQRGDGLQARLEVDGRERLVRLLPRGARARHDRGRRALRRWCRVRARSASSSCSAPACAAPSPRPARSLMLAYRHAFHAGNHADVLKHTVLTLVLRYMGTKDKAYRLVDTHAGAGGYSLEGRYAQKKGEFEQGIGRLWTRDDLPEALADYVALVRHFNPDGVLAQYPGSPAFAQMLLRAAGPAARCSSCTRPISRSSRDLGRRSPARGLRRRRLRRPAGQLPPSTPARRRADGPELRRQRRLRPGGRVAARGDRALRRRRVRRLVPAGQQARGGAAAASGSRRSRRRAGCTRG